MSIQELHEVSFDGIVGPTHHFGGLGVGNVASQSHVGQVAYPRAAALQGIEKMRRCASLGLRQAIFPPQQRPVLRTLRRLGFCGSDGDVLQRTAETAPHLLSAVWSASSMWSANAATVSAGPACADKKIHLTIANLSSSLHRSLEAPQTLRLFRHVFRDSAFVVHPPLPGIMALRDEGAANHMRLTDLSGTRGIDLFVYGDDESAAPGPKRFRSRQSLEASKAIARLHGLDPRSTFFLRQHPEAIAAGAFHNDVVATSHRNVWLHHERAYLDANSTIAEIEERFELVTGQSLQRCEIPEAELPLCDTVSSYLFNGQLLPSDHGPESMTMLCPEQVRETPAALRSIESLIDSEGPIVACEFVELRESMNNGGGPACLRLRVPMEEANWKSLPGNLRFCEPVADQLCRVIESTYPAKLEISDLTSLELAQQVRHAVRELNRVLGLLT